MKKISFVSCSSLLNVVLIVLNILTKQKDHKQVLTTYKFPSLCCTVEIQLRMCRKISKYWKSILIVRSKIVHCLADISISPLTGGFSGHVPVSLSQGISMKTFVVNLMRLSHISNIHSMFKTPVVSN